MGSDATDEPNQGWIWASMTTGRPNERHPPRTACNSFLHSLFWAMEAQHRTRRSKMGSGSGSDFKPLLEYILVLFILIIFFAGCLRMPCICFRNSEAPADLGLNYKVECGFVSMMGILHSAKYSSRGCSSDFRCNVLIIRSREHPQGSLTCCSIKTVKTHGIL